MWIILITMGTMTRCLVSTMHGVRLNSVDIPLLHNPIIIPFVMILITWNLLLPLLWLLELIFWNNFFIEIFFLWVNKFLDDSLHTCFSTFVISSNPFYQHPKKRNHKHLSFSSSYPLSLITHKTHIKTPTHRRNVGVWKF